MHATAVNPPAAAARVPLAIVSLYSWPGSRRWTWMSMNPGATTRPPASMVSAPGGASSRGPTRATRLDQPVARHVHAVGGVDYATVADQEVHRSGLPAALGADQEVEDRHAHGDPVRHLLEDDRVGPIGHLGRHLDAAVDRAGVHDQNVLPADADTLTAT